MSERQGKEGLRGKVSEARLQQGPQVRGGHGEAHPGATRRGVGQIRMRSVPESWLEKQVSICSYFVVNKSPHKC